MSIDDIENELGIKSYPMNWPIGCGADFKGVAPCAAAPRGFIMMPQILFPRPGRPCHPLSRKTIMLEALGVSLPIIQAPMAGVSTPRLAAAVSNAARRADLMAIRIFVNMPAPLHAKDAKARVLAGASVPVSSAKASRRCRVPSR
ncbi:hypothetical protein DPM13_07815 [Paracoccus mutanolyticus]|uniref:Nitronate monooxygenase domain-containing protein n=1 Tax=Paracoccus mutanolyticus TaxID=1499308 RepID=A0ABM6WR49_9RHOB|nr:hypothetical protein DPM13_07815 [Paracoccus mutanolyticus]